MHSPPPPSKTNRAAPASEPPLATLCGLLSVLTAAKGAVGALAPAKMLEAALGASAVTPETTALMGAVAAVSWIVAAWLAALRVRNGGGGEPARSGFLGAVGGVLRPHFRWEQQKPHTCSDNHRTTTRPANDDDGDDDDRTPSSTAASPRTRTSASRSASATSRCCSGSRCCASTRSCRRRRSREWGPRGRGRGGGRANWLPAVLLRRGDKQRLQPSPNTQH